MATLRLYLDTRVKRQRLLCSLLMKPSNLMQKLLILNRIINMNCDSLRKAPGRRQISFDPEISEWGNPPTLRQVSYDEYIVIRSERGEVKHLSTRRKRNQLRFPQQRRAKGEKPIKLCVFQWNALGSATIVGDSPVHERAHIMMTSRARHVKPCLNMGGPSSKAKYS